MFPTRNLLFLLTWLLASATCCLAQGQTSESTVVQLQVPANLSTPAAGCQYIVPVVVIAYLPSDDGVMLNKEVTDVNSTLSAIGNKIDLMDQQIKFALEEGSRFHGYKDPDAKPSLGYKIVACIAVYEKIPRGPIKCGEGKYHPDYNQILNRFNAKKYVEEQGVKEFWIWGYHHGDIEPNESNMSSPLSGNISNSERRADVMPIFSRSYVLYNYNYGRTASEAIHDHGHQLEHMLNYINIQQDGNTDLFGKDFMGRVGTYPDVWTTGRCGWTHMPPNTIKDYNYEDSTFVESDIEDWTPERVGKLARVNSFTWGIIPYHWPGLYPPENRTEAQWYVFWRQNIPGLGNHTPYKNGVLTNWWRFIGDWDGALRDKMGLYAPKPHS